MERIDAKTLALVTILTTTFALGALSSTKAAMIPANFIRDWSKQ